MSLFAQPSSDRPTIRTPEDATPQCKRIIKEVNQLIKEKYVHESASELEFDTSNGKRTVVAFEFFILHFHIKVRYDLGYPFVPPKVGVGAFDNANKKVYVRWDMFTYYLCGMPTLGRPEMDHTYVKYREIADLFGKAWSPALTLAALFPRMHAFLAEFEGNRVAEDVVTHLSEYNV